MERKLRYGDASILYRVRRRNGRREGRVAIHVEPDGQVLVDAPQKASDEHVAIAVRRRAGWIHRHVSEARRRLALTQPREYVSGEGHLYLGRRYQLKVVRRSDGPAAARLRRRYIEISTPRSQARLVRAILNDWYREQAKDYLTKRLENASRSLRWLQKSPPLRFQLMRIQWGSCSPSGRLTLNPMLVKAPPECIDYVLLHELCHLREHNHGPRFYALLDRHMPDWRRRKQRLDCLVEQILL